MTVDEAVDVEYDDNVRSLLTIYSPAVPPPDSVADRRAYRERRNHVTGILDEMCSSRYETRRYNSYCLELGIGQLNASVKTAVVARPTAT